MGFVHQYGPNPETLGAYAFSGSAAKATRENLQRAAELRQNAAQFNAQLRQHATDRAVNQYDRQQSREATLLQQQMEGESYALKNQFELQQSQEANANKLQIEQMQQQTARANQFEQTKQEWLKQGIAKYSPQNKQQLSELQRQASVIESDNSIPPEHKDQMIANLQGKMQAIIPQIVPEDERPTPLHQRLAESTGIMTSTGEIIPGGKRAPQPGEWIGTQVTRNGSQQTKWEQVPPIKDTGDNWSSQKFIAQQRAIIRNGLVNQRNSEYDRELRTWEAKQKQYKDAFDSEGEKTSAPPPGPMPITPKVEDWEVDAKLHAISGGVVMPTMQAPQQNQQGSWPRPAMMGGYSPVQGASQQQQPASSMPQQAHAVQDYGPLPSGTGRMTTPVTRKQDRQMPGAVASHLESEGLTPYAQREGLTDRDYAVMPSDAFEQTMRVLRGKRDFAIASQANPVQVKSQDDAKRLPFGTKFILNGRTGTVQ